MEIIDLYQNGLRYDAMFHGKHDLAFFKAEAKKAGDPILEPCCGTGRIFLPLLEAGFSCTGIDNSHEMIEVARQKISHHRYGAELVLADAASLTLGKKF